MVSIFSPFPEQYTQEWYSLARVTVGGSDVNKLRTVSIDKIVSEKVIKKVCPEFDYTILLNGKDCGRNLQMFFNWGTIMEPVMASIISRLFGPVQYNNASYFKGPWRYSPDGIVNGKLLEIKSPFSYMFPAFSPESRFITEDYNKNIKEQYYDQVQLGMNLLDINETLFAEGIIRFLMYLGNRLIPEYMPPMQKMKYPNSATSIKDIPELEYEEIHLADKIPTGFIAFYEKDYSGPVIDFRDRKNKSVLCNAIYHKMETRYFYKIDDIKKTVNVHYGKIIEECKESNNVLNLYGISQYAILGLHFVKIQRDPNFITESLEQIANGVHTACLNVISTSEVLQDL
jgi:hypothetical protein